MTFKKSGLGCNKVEQVRENAFSEICIKVAALLYVDSTKGDYICDTGSLPYFVLLQIIESIQFNVHFSFKR